MGRNTTFFTKKFPEAYTFVSEIGEKKQDCGNNPQTYEKILKYKKIVRKSNRTNHPRKRKTHGERYEIG